MPSCWVIWPYFVLHLCVSSCRYVGNNIMLLTNAFKGKFIIPNFAEFTQQINKMYESAYQQEAGQVSPPNTHTHRFCFSASVAITLRGFYGLIRWLISSLSWLSSALSCGVFLCAPWMDRGTMDSSAWSSCCQDCARLYPALSFCNLFSPPDPSWHRADTLSVTPKFPSVCSRVWSPWRTPSPCTTSALSARTSLWEKSPADSDSTNCPSMMEVRPKSDWNPQNSSLPGKRTEWFYRLLLFAPVWNIFSLTGLFLLWSCDTPFSFSCRQTTQPNGECWGYCHQLSNQGKI